jgi:hypothetical protein
MKNYKYKIASKRADAGNVPFSGYCKHQQVRKAAIMKT